MEAVLDPIVNFPLSGLFWWSYKVPFCYRVPAFFLYLYPDGSNNQFFVQKVIKAISCEKNDTCLTHLATIRWTHIEKLQATFSKPQVLASKEDRQKYSVVGQHLSTLQKYTIGLLKLLSIEMYCHNLNVTENLSRYHCTVL